MRSVPVKMLKVRASRRALVDDEDYEEIVKHRWHEHSAGYSVTKVGINPSYKDVYMHRMVMGLHEKLGGTKDVIDHINHNKLDNRKENLRACSSGENTRNRKGAQSNNKSSGILGVSWCRIMNKWRARITFDGKEKLLGYFEDKDEASKLIKDYRNAK